MTMYERGFDHDTGDDFDREAWLAEMEKRQRESTEHSWRQRLTSGPSKETARFAKALMEHVPPQELTCRKFPLPLASKFGQVTLLAEELGMRLEHESDVGNLLEQGYEDIRSAILNSDMLKGVDSLEQALAAVLHESTVKSIHNMSLANQEAMRGLIQRGIPTKRDEQTGLVVLNLPEQRPAYSRNTVNTGCPYASRGAILTEKTRQPVPIFDNFTRYAGEIVARQLIR